MAEIAAPGGDAKGEEKKGAYPVLSGDVFVRLAVTKLSKSFHSRSFSAGWREWDRMVTFPANEAADAPT